MKNRKVRRVINKQKIFSFASLIFIIVCFLWYGGRFIYFYLDSRKNISDSSISFSNTIINSNKKSDNFSKINDSYYFINNADNNYVRYSNVIWRIVKISDNKVFLISDKSLTSLAYGNNVSNYNESYVYKWLNSNNDEYSGILENNLSKVSNYLDKYSVCIDKIDDASKVSCNKKFNDGYIGLLSVIDYVNTGGIKSFINNGEYSYLSNSTDNDGVWYITSDGKLDSSDGSDIYGVKPVISLNSKVSIKSGDGSSKNPYVIDDDKNLFASYVKLGDDIWRVYDTDNGKIKLMLNDYLVVDNDKLSYKYSSKNYFHNDTVYGSLAYYLNQTYLNSLSYNNVILASNFANGFYDNDFDYMKILSKSVDTKVSVISIGNVMFNNDFSDVWTNTGVSNNSDEVYILEKSRSLSTKSVDGESYVIPCIEIDSSILTKGNGTLDVPYEME